jgi:hypothetical protein
MLAFVLNLRSRPDRWERIKKRFEGTSIQVVRIAARKHKVGAYGCFLSFIKALKKARAMKIPGIILMEDDCLPTPGWEKRWLVVRRWLDNNPDKWEIYSGGVWQMIEPVEIGRTEGVVFYDPMWSVAAHWLYVPERSYDKLIDYYERVAIGTRLLPLAGINVHNNLFKTVTSYPFIAYQENGSSDISGKGRMLEQAFADAERQLKPRSLRGRQTRRAGASKRVTRKRR